MRLDGSGADRAQRPSTALLSALAACTAVDVVDILAKRRTPVESLDDRRRRPTRFDGTPGRLTRVRSCITLRGAGIERVHAERAIELAVTKYCSVRDSLDPATPVTWRLELAE